MARTEPAENRWVTTAPPATGANKTINIAKTAQPARTPLRIIRYRLLRKNCSNPARCNMGPSERLRQAPIDGGSYATRSTVVEIEATSDASRSATTAATTG